MKELKLSGNLPICIWQKEMQLQLTYPVRCMASNNIQYKLLFAIKKW